MKYLDALWVFRSGIFGLKCEFLWLNWSLQQKWFCKLTFGHLIIVNIQAFDYLQPLTSLEDMGVLRYLKKWTKMKLTVRIFEKYICWCSQCPPNPLILNQKHIRDFDRGSYLYIGLPWWLFLSSWPPNTDHTVTMIMILMIKTVIWQV